jgi:hypothetical protein
MRPRMKGALLLLLAFGLGIAGGAAGFGLYHTRLGGWRSPEGAARFQDRILSRLTKEIDLRSEQRQKVETVLKEAGQEQTKFDTVSQEWERRMERWRGRGPGDGPERKAP